VSSGAVFRFYADLNDFLPTARKGRDVAVSFAPGATVKDLIESVGVPHAEVDLVLANGESVGFDYRVADRGHVSVYPVFVGLDISPVTRLRPTPLGRTSFVLDTHLGRLTRYLRLLGCDSRYGSDLDDDDLVRISVHEGRILLTRDVGLLKRRVITHGYFVRANRPGDQLTEVLRRFDLSRVIRPFRRCMVCNGVLRSVTKDDVAEALLPGTRRDFDEFWTCPECHRVYWKGSHYERLAALVEDVRGDTASPTDSTALASRYGGISGRWSGRPPR
jgi:uncharacterized protein with PIN domain